jgi:hypothetical protein
MRTVIISTNDNPAYSFYVPIVTWAWNKLGWDVLVLKPFELPPYREETITQVCRLYAAMLKQFSKEDIIMISDADMIPLSNYWTPTSDNITCYGHDLTGYNHYPMCYIAMSKNSWGKVMNLNSNNIKELMERDLKDTNALSDEWSKWWQVDQDIITDRLSKFEVTKIDRGIEPGSHFPLGRIDRGNGMNITGTLIDCHAPRDGWQHIEKIKEILKLSFNDLPAWIDSYTRDFKNKLQIVA